MTNHLFDELTEENFILFASRFYDNPQCTSIEEFNEDILRFKYLKKLFNRYIYKDDLQERLILNHMIVIYNTFGVNAANKMIFYKMERIYWSMIKSFLVYLQYIDNDELINIPLDPVIVKVLREL